MKQIIVLTIALLFSINAPAQLMQPDWYVLEKGAEVGIIKPGVNDLTFFLAASGNKPIDKEAVDSMNKRTKFPVGSVVLIYAQENGMYIATDMEGRNLVIKGNVTKAKRGIGCTVGYMKITVTEGNTTLKKNSFVWIQEHKPGSENVKIQGLNKQSLIVPIAKVYDINATTAEMAATTTFKTAE